ncbi:MAG: hypothetical protein J3R72DRAFT_33741 [Linnemannia gamsii]|nr:MAG: hypothetical protein J3R72DRAFT_33741 [Linnemannia gamsii]
MMAIFAGTSVAIRLFVSIGYLVVVDVGIIIVTKSILLLLLSMVMVMLLLLTKWQFAVVYFQGWRVVYVITIPVSTVALCCSVLLKVLTVEERNISHMTFM